MVTTPVSGEGSVTVVSFTDHPSANIPRPMSYINQPEQAPQLPIRWTPPRGSGMADFEDDNQSTLLKARSAEWYRTHT
jgi:hypothetical protein